MGHVGRNVTVAESAVVEETVNLYHRAVIGENAILRGPGLITVRDSAHIENVTIEAPANSQGSLHPHAIKTFANNCWIDSDDDWWSEEDDDGWIWTFYKTADFYPQDAEPILRGKPKWEVGSGCAWGIPLDLTVSRGGLDFTKSRSHPAMHDRWLPDEETNKALADRNHRMEVAIESIRAKLSIPGAPEEQPEIE